MNERGQTPILFFVEIFLDFGSLNLELVTKSESFNLLRFYALIDIPCVEN